MAVGTPFAVDTAPTKEVVVNGITRDASVEACIFDLIDNAIDGARDTLFKGIPSDAHEVLPDSYDGFRIELTLNSTGLKIVDNCGGIAVDSLKNMVLRFGRQSDHEMGIGAFGVGLNRALFKLGTVSHLRTDTGSQRAELVLKTKEYLDSPGWELPAEEFQSAGVVGTEIEIRSPPDDIALLFGDSLWGLALRAQVGARYARFLTKKLAILIDGVPTESQEVPLRDGGPYDGEHKFFKAGNGVAVHLKYGQHRDHRFTNEADYDADRNREITDEFGWTVVCNDRAILMSDRTDKTGWTTRFHTEFYGFVGVASFIGTHPSKLPWNTTKTDVDLNNSAYREALSEMRQYAENWRKIATKRKKKGSTTSTPAKKTKTDAATKKGKGQAAGSGATETVTMKKSDHDQLREILPDDVDERHCYDKHLRLVHEAKGLDLAELTYAGLAVIRMVFELSAIKHLDRHGKFSDLKQFAIDRRRSKGVTIKPEDEGKITPSLDEMLVFLDNKPEIWGAAGHSHLRHSLKRMGAHQKMLNGAVHNPFQVVGSATAYEIRNEVLPLLRHLIEN